MKFGIEMEMIGITADMAQNAIRNAGIAVAAESYNHTTKPWWKIVPDSSFRDNEGRPTQILATDTDCRGHYMTPGSKHSRAIGEIIEPSDAK